MISKENIVVILPAYNEAMHLQSLCNQIKQSGFNHICIINDGSTDTTKELEFDTNVILLTHVLNRGAGAATDTGLQYAKLKKFDAAITMDADGQHEVSDLNVLYEAYIKSNADLLIGSRFMNATNKIPIHRRYYNHIANLISYAFAAYKISDTQSGLKLFSKKAIQEIDIQTDGYEFCSEIIIKAIQKKWIIKEVPIRVNYTEYSLSKGQGVINGFKTVFNLMANMLVAEK